MVWRGAPRVAAGLILLAGVVPGAPAAAAQPGGSGIVSIETRVQPALQSALETSLRIVAAEKEVPGMAVAAVRGDAIVASAQTGVRALGSPASVAPGDRFHIGSLAKAMTATMIAGLVEEGRLSWTTRPDHAFPELATRMHPSLRGLTLEELLSHRSGLAPFTSGSEWRTSGAPAFNGSPVEQRRQFALWLLSRPAKGRRGRYEYGNSNYAIAAAMVERLTGRSWEESMRTRLFEPLGLRSAGFGWPYVAARDQPWGHWLREGRLVPHAPEDAYRLTQILAPAGDIHMSADDLARFAAMHLAGLRGLDGLLQAATIRRLHSPAPGAAYAMGWLLEPGAYDEPFSQHTGATGVFRAQMWIFPARDLAMVSLANADTGAVEEAGSSVLQRVRRAAIDAESEAGESPRR